ncbi:MAG: glycosyltransferase [Ilumatobacteraceae bacterium]
MTASPLTIDWVVLTMGDRPEQLGAAVRSLLDQLGDHDRVVVVANGADHVDLHDGPGVELVTSDHNLGVPGGRALGVRSGRADIVAFLDDDAVLLGRAERIRQAFEHDPGLAAVSLRLVDEDGRSLSRHVPRPGGSDPSVSGVVVHFLGGASAIRRSAYEEVGGYFVDLFYGHEEIELSWRLIDAGWSIRYLAEVEVVHPRTEISRHAEGWRLTGRNRVWIARRTLPWPVAVVHTLTWLILGLVRCGAANRRSYVAGWWTGWRSDWPSGVPRRPIRWATVLRLTRLGRPPVI